MSRTESLLLRSTGATSVDALMVYPCLNWLLRFLAAQGNPSDVAFYPQPSQHIDRTVQDAHQHHPDITFDLHLVNNTGEGVEKITAETSRKLCVPDCSGQKSRPLCTDHTRGSLVRWPVRERLILPTTATIGMGGGNSCGSFEQSEEICSGEDAWVDGGDAFAQSGRNDRSWIRRSIGRDDADNRSPSNLARIEGTTMPLCSKTFEVESMLCESELPSVKAEKVVHGLSRYSGSPNEDLKAGASFLDEHGSKTDVAGLISQYEAPNFRSDRKEEDGYCSAWKEGGADRMPLAKCTESDSDLVDWSINMFDLNAEQQLSLVARFYRSMGLTETFNISDQKLINFLLAVGKRYHDHPFHNLAHATSVTHAVFMIIKTTRIDSLLRPLDKLGLITAAFCHDIDHPGNNNAYEVNTLSPLAQLHGDSAVLERHHIYVAHQVLLEDRGANNIMSELTRSQLQEVHEVINQAILATDMSRHFQYCDKLADFAQKAKSIHGGERGGGRQSERVTPRPLPGKGASRQCEGSQARVTSAEPEIQDKSLRREAASTEHAPRSAIRSASRTQGTRRRHSFQGDDRSYAGNKSSRARQERRIGKDEEPFQLFSVDKAEDRLFLSETIIHCADLSGQMLDAHLAQEWGRRILEEFRLQAELETRAGLPSTTVASNDLKTSMKDQHFFATKIVKPLWGPFVSIFPDLEPLLENLNINCDFYQREVARLERDLLATVPSRTSMREQKTSSAGNRDAA